MSQDHEITNADVLKLIVEILECVQDDKGKVADVTVFSDEILVVEFPQGERFRINITDTKKFN
jgi:hypothetical protein